MEILLFLLLELATISISNFINMKSGCDSIIDIGKRGYKIDADKLEEIKEKREFEKLTSNPDFRDLIRCITAAIPFVNICYTLYNKKRVRDEFFDYIEPALIPMTEEDKEAFENADSNIKKMMLVTYQDKEVEKVKHTDNSSMYKIHSFDEIYFEKILPLSYTLDELENIQSIYTDETKSVVGRCDNRNIAFVGVPKDHELDLISFLYESPGYKYEYITKSKSEMKNERFLIYPYSSNSLLDEKIEEIRNKRYGYVNNTRCSYIKSVDKPKVLIKRKH